MNLEETLRCAPELEDLCTEGEGVSLASEFWGWRWGICLGEHRQWELGRQ